MEFSVVAGQDYVIYWSDTYNPGPFTWTLIEGNYGEEWSNSFNFFEEFPNQIYPNTLEIYFYGDVTSRGQYFSFDPVTNPDLTKYQAYSNFISSNRQRLMLKLRSSFIRSRWHHCRCWSKLLSSRRYWRYPHPSS